MKKIVIAFFITASCLAATAQSDTLQQYVGTYVFPEGTVVPSVDVKYDNGALTMSSAAGNSSLTQLGVDSFSIVEFGGTAVFKRENGKVTMVHVDAAGYIMDGKKQEGNLWISRQYYFGKRTEELFK